MRKGLITISAILFFFSATEFHQLVRIPLLAAHYQQHLKTAPGMSLFAYLKLHYTPNHPDDRDDDQDNHLPFKQTDAITHIDQTITWPQTEEKEQPVFTVRSSPAFHPEGVPCHRAAAVFHPPKC